MGIDQIKYFSNLADTVYFTEAERRSGVSQPSLTKSIYNLAEELGGRFMDRDVLMYPRFSAEREDFVQQIDGRRHTCRLFHA